MGSVKMRPKQSFPKVATGLGIKTLRKQKNSNKQTFVGQPTNVCLGEGGKKRDAMYSGIRHCGGAGCAVRACRTNHAARGFPACSEASPVTMGERAIRRFSARTVMDFPQAYPAYPLELSAINRSADGQAQGGIEKLVYSAARPARLERVAAGASWCALRVSAMRGPNRASSQPEIRWTPCVGWTASCGKPHGEPLDCWPNPRRVRHERCKAR